MARPKKFDQDTALTTAMHSIWKNGFALSSVKQLSELLNMTRSSFYNAFESREGLFRACLPKYRATSPDVDLHTENVGDVLPLITRVFKGICAARANDPEGRGCLIVNTVAELCPQRTNPKTGAPEADGLGHEMAEIMLGSAQRIEELLTMARDNGELSATTDIHATALALQNLMIGLNVFCKIVRSEDELWLLAKTTLDGLGVYRE